jgi:hypothetical protein
MLVEHHAVAFGRVVQSQSRLRRDDLNSRFPGVLAAVIND